VQTSRRLRAAVAHRLTTLSLCDRLIVVREGRLEAFAPAQDLYGTNDFYRQAMDMPRRQTCRVTDVVGSSVVVPMLDAPTLRGGLESRVIPDPFHVGIQVREKRRETSTRTAQPAGYLTKRTIPGVAAGSETEHAGAGRR
jgi:hypothetical protein